MIPWKLIPPLLTAPLLAAPLLAAPLLAGCEVDCPALYESSPARHCMSYERSFEYYACTDDKVTDPGCFRDCIEDLVDDTDLCYNVDDCVSRCSDDDASGCAILYSVNNHDKCIDYKAFYVVACDARLTATKRSCARTCHEAQSDCAAYKACLAAC